MTEQFSRRTFLMRSGAALGALSTSGFDSAHSPGLARTSPVAIGKSNSYGVPGLTRDLEHLFDLLGGIRKLVSGKTVAIKFNLTGAPGQPAVGMPAGRTYQTHPDLAVALAAAFERAGARRLRFIESSYSAAPIEHTLAICGWDIKALAALKIPVEFEDTRNAGGKPYVTLKVPGGGSLFPAYQLNHSYADCDVYVSVAKLKNHRTAGVTLSLKNSFGITPTSLYASHKASEEIIGARIDTIHRGIAAPASGIPQEIDPSSPRRETYRVPRNIVDLAKIRPIDLAIIDGIETISGGEGPWYNEIQAVKPGLLIAGRNPVCTDAVATACMGYDPQAASGTQTFPGDNHLTLAQPQGLGSCDLKQIEVVGVPVSRALFPFHWTPSR